MRLKNVALAYKLLRLASLQCRLDIIFRFPKSAIVFLGKERANCTNRKEKTIADDFSTESFPLLDLIYNCICFHCFSLVDCYTRFVVGEKVSILNTSCQKAELLYNQASYRILKKSFSVKQTFIL